MSPQTPVQREAGSDAFPQRIAIIAAEDARAPTPEDLARLVTSSASPDVQIQRAAIRALGRLERRDLVTTLLPRLRDASPLVRADAAFAIAQSMRGEKLPLDIAGSQVEGVLGALAGALASERDPSTVREIIRSIARLPYERAEQVNRAEILVRQVLTLSNELSIARAARLDAQKAVGLRLPAASPQRNCWPGSTSSCRLPRTISSPVCGAMSKGRHPECRARRHRLLPRRCRHS